MDCQQNAVLEGYKKIGEKRGIQIGEKQGELDFTCVFLTVRLLSTYLC